MDLLHAEVAPEGDAIALRRDGHLHWTRNPRQPNWRYVDDDVRMAHVAGGHVVFLKGNGRLVLLNTDSFQHEVVVDRILDFSVSSRVLAYMVPEGRTVYTKRLAISYPAFRLDDNIAEFRADANTVAYIKPQRRSLFLHDDSGNRYVDDDLLSFKMVGGALVYMQSSRRTHWNPISVPGEGMYLGDDGMTYDVVGTTAALLQSSRRLRLKVGSWRLTIPNVRSYAVGPDAVYYVQDDLRAYVVYEGQAPAYLEDGVFSVTALGWGGVALVRWDSGFIFIKGGENRIHRSLEQAVAQVGDIWGATLNWTWGRIPSTPFLSNVAALSSCAIQWQNDQGDDKRPLEYFGCKAMETLVEYLRDREREARINDAIERNAGNYNDAPDDVRERMSRIA